MINHANENNILDDANSPELDKKILGMVSTDFLKVADQLKEACYQIKTRGFSSYPIIVVTKTDTPVGQVFFKKGDLENEYTYKATMLEEFIQRNLVGQESVALFKENYKNLDEYCCLFVILGEFASFIYIPYPED
jgi:hypothetical protein